MIRVKVEISKGLKDLARELKKFQDYAHGEKEWVITELFKSVNNAYVQAVEDHVYSLYNPIEYKRTGHIMGDHGAKQEEVTQNKYEFYIDEQSRDPVDGTTWMEKADTLEHGSRTMYGTERPMPDRPFIDEIQAQLEVKNRLMSDRFVTSVNRRLSKIQGRAR